VAVDWIEPPDVPCCCTGTADASCDTTARKVCATLLASAFFR